MPIWDVMHGRRNDRSIKASMPHPKCSIWPYFCRKDREINKRPYLGVGVLCARMKTNELNLVDWIKRLSQAILVTNTHFLVRIDAARESSISRVALYRLPLDPPWRNPLGYSVTTCILPAHVTILYSTPVSINGEAS